jgi:hypothetical protein
MVEALPPRATRFNHEIAAASMAKRTGRYDFRPFGLASSVMVNAAFRPLTPLLPPHLASYFQTSQLSALTTFGVRINEI